MPGRGRAFRVRKRQQHEHETPASDTASPRGGHDRWSPHAQRGRVFDGPYRRNSIPQSTRPNHNSIDRRTHVSRPSLVHQRSQLFLPRRRDSTTSTSHNPHNLRPCTALSRLNDGSRASYRDIHHPKYHNMIRDLISQGSQLTQTLQDFLRDIEFMLKSDSEEMDWDHTDQKEVVRDGTSREEWEAIKPEVKNPFDRLMVEKVQITLTMHERMDEG